MDNLGSFAGGARSERRRLWTIGGYLGNTPSGLEREPACESAT